MSEQDELTPEYIASIANTLTEEELANLIWDYGNKKAEDASYSQGKDER